MDQHARVGRVLRLLLFSWLCSLLLAAALAVRIDARSSTLRRLDSSGELKSMSDRQVDDETRKAERLYQVSVLAQSLVLPPAKLCVGCLAVLGLCWFLRGRVKGRAVAPVAAAAMLPGSIADLLDAVVAFRHAAIPPDGVALVPRTLSAVTQVLGHALSGAWFRLGNVPDLFSFWAAVILAFGVASAGQLPPRHAVVTTLAAWLCYRLLTQVALGG